MSRKGMFRGILLTAFFLVSCGVEPEKRAYPLAVTLDVRDGRYEAGFGMGDLSALTGQGKAEKEEKELQIYTGDTLKEVREDYSRSQQYYLDTGHVQAVLLGEGFLEEEAFLEQALAEMEDNRMLGSGCYVFSCKEPEVFLKLDGSEVDSLVEYLAGVYKNRPSDQREDAVTLQEVYTAWHDRGELPPLPAVTLGENQKILVDNPD